MSALFVRLMILSFVGFAILFFFGQALYPIFEHFGQPREVHSTLSSGFLAAGVIFLALIFVRTIIGIVIALLLAAILFILAYLFLGPIL